MGRIATSLDYPAPMTRGLIVAQVSWDVPRRIHRVVQETEHLHASTFDDTIQELVTGAPTAPTDGVEEEARSSVDWAAPLRMLDDARQRFFDDLLVAVIL